MLHLLSDLKSRLKLVDTIDDAILTQLSEGVQGHFEAHCARQFQHQAGVFYICSAAVLTIVLPRYPVTAITEVAARETRTSPWVACAGLEFESLDAAGIINFDAVLGQPNDNIRITYSGGYRLPNDPVNVTLQDLPTAIQMASIEQTAYRYQNRDRLGLSSVAGSGLISRQQQALLPEVEAALAPYRRILM